MTLVEASPLVVLSACAALACACSCPDTVFGVHDGDRIKTTIVAPYQGSSEYAVAAYSDSPPCGGFDDLLPGSTLTFQASLDRPANGCPIARVGLTLESSNVAGYSPTMTQWTVAYDAGGCTGQVSLDFVTLGNSPSLYDNGNSADGGNVLWVLGRQYVPQTVPAPDAGSFDGGLCPSVTCAGVFIARNERL